LPEWLGCREILHRRDPYRPEITQQIELAVDGRILDASGATRNQHRFAYPVFFVILFFPFALLPFAAAQLAALVVCITLTAISIPLWLGSQWKRPDRLTVTIFAFAAYPVVLALQLRQPTLIIVSLLAGVVFCVRSGRLLLAGVLAALCAAKPQLAIAVLLPVSIWSVAAWRIRKAFLISLFATLSALLLASELAVPGWFAPWLNTIRAYSHYAGARPLLADLLRGHSLLPAALLLACLVCWISFRFRDTDLLFAISFSAAVSQLLFPFQIYNSVLLLPAALWLAGNASRIKARGQLPALLCSCTWIVLGAGWVSAVGLSLSNVLAPGSALRLWPMPLAAAYLYPFALAACLGSLAVLKAVPATVAPPASAPLASPPKGLMLAEKMIDG